MRTNAGISRRDNIAAESTRIITQKTSKETNATSTQLAWPI